MTKYIFVQKKSLVFSLQRYIYDNLRYKYGYFVHRKTFFDDVILIHDSYFHFVWRYFFIQDKEINESELNEIDKNEFEVNIMDNYVKSIVLNNSESIYSTKMMEQYNKVFDPSTLLYNNKQSLTEFLYLTPLNMFDDTIEQYRKIFISNIEITDHLFNMIRDMELNINLYDIGIVSYINNESLLFDFLKKEKTPFHEIDFNSFKLILWNLINQQCFTIEPLELIKLKKELKDVDFTKIV